jgi:hypothetical protein
VRDEDAEGIAAKSDYDNEMTMIEGRHEAFSLSVYTSISPSLVVGGTTEGRHEQKVNRREYVQAPTPIL